MISFLGGIGKVLLGIVREKRVSNAGRVSRLARNMFTSIKYNPLEKKIAESNQIEIRKHERNS